MTCITSCIWHNNFYQTQETCIQYFPESLNIRRYYIVCYPSRECQHIMLINLIDIILVNKSFHDCRQWCVIEFRMQCLNANFHVLRQIILHNYAYVLHYWVWSKFAACIYITRHVVLCLPDFIKIQSRTILKIAKNVCFWNKWPCA